MTTIHEKRVLITGGASGIGLRMAKIMAGKGARIILWDIDGEKLEAVGREMEEAGREVICRVCDVGDRASVYTAAEEVKGKTGGIDILINNAGVVSGRPFLECADEEVERTIRINTMAAFWTVKAFLPDMLEADSGHVVNISSAGGLLGVARLADYSASKFALFGFDESLRAELKRRRSGVRTTVVCPYYINTGMFAGVKTRFPFLLPILNEAKVAKKIVRAVERNRPRLFMPWIVYTVGPLRLFPVWIFDVTANVLGINHSMDDFKGRSTDEQRSAAHE